MTTIEMERAACSIDDFQATAWDVGSWCYWNDMPCPYNTDSDYMEWKAGYMFAATREVGR